MKKVAFFMVAVLFANAISPALLGGIPSDKAVYRGGTVASVPENATGAVATTDEHHFTFTYKNGRLTVPYERVNSLEYGQKAGDFTPVARLPVDGGVGVLAQCDGILVGEH